MNKIYKRTSRSVSKDTKEKISSSLKAYNGTHPRSKEHNQKIAQRT